MITCFHHYDILATTCIRMTKALSFQLKWCWFTSTHYLMVLRKSHPHCCPHVVVNRLLLLNYWRGHVMAVLLLTLWNLMLNTCKWQHQTCAINNYFNLQTADRLWKTVRLTISRFQKLQCRIAICFNLLQF